MNNNTSMFSSYGLYDKFIDKLKGVFSGGATKENVVDCVDSIDTIINKGIDDKLNNKIRSSDIATKRDIDSLALATRQDIELVRSDVKHDISKIFNKVLWVFCTGTASIIVTILISHISTNIPK